MACRMEFVEVIGRIDDHLFRILRLSRNKERTRIIGGSNSPLVKSLRIICMHLAAYSVYPRTVELFRNLDVFWLNSVRSIHLVKLKHAGPA